MRAPARSCTNLHEMPRFRTVGGSLNAPSARSAAPTRAFRDLPLALPPPAPTLLFVTFVPFVVQPPCPPSRGSAARSCTNLHEISRSRPVGAPSTTPPAQRAFPRPRLRPRIHPSSLILQPFCPSVSQCLRVSVVVLHAPARTCTKFHRSAVFEEVSIAPAIRPLEQTAHR